MKLDSGADFITFSFDSVMLQEQDLPFGSKRLLEVNNRLVVPVMLLCVF